MYLCLCTVLYSDFGVYCQSLVRRGRQTHGMCVTGRGQNTQTQFSLCRRDSFPDSPCSSLISRRASASSSVKRFTSSCRAFSCFFICPRDTVRLSQSLSASYRTRWEVHIQNKAQDCQMRLMIKDPYLTQTAIKTLYNHSITNNNFSSEK